MSVKLVEPGILFFKDSWGLNVPALKKNSSEIFHLVKFETLTVVIFVQKRNQKH